MKKTNKTSTYVITAKNGNQYQWTFTECEPDRDDYGNGIYIHVKMPSGDTTLIDCRYISLYEFNITCVDYLNSYYGSNLIKLEVINQ